MQFKLTELETNRWKDFEMKHFPCSKNTGAIGGIFDFIISPTSIGSFVKVKCTRCGKMENITDYDKF